MSEALIVKYKGKKLTVVLSLHSSEGDLADRATNTVESMSTDDPSS